MQNAPGRLLSGNLAKRLGSNASWACASLHAAILRHARSIMLTPQPARGSAPSPPSLYPAASQGDCQGRASRGGGGRNHLGRRVLDHEDLLQRPRPGGAPARPQPQDTHHRFGGVRLAKPTQPKLHPTKSAARVKRFGAFGAGGDSVVSSVVSAGTMMHGRGRAV